MGNELDLSKAEEGRKHQFKDRERKGLGEEMVKEEGERVRNKQRFKENSAFTFL